MSMIKCVLFRIIPLNLKLIIGEPLEKETSGVSPRYGHAMIMHNRKIIIFGGASKGNGRNMVLNDLWEFSLGNY